MIVKIHDEPAAEFAIEIIGRLRHEGFTAYLAGGCVRDALLGMHPKDFDVATDATPETVRRLFGRKRTLPIGLAFGVINVLPPRGSTAHPVEVATFRSDGDYSDGRRPDSVSFGDPYADAVRRDFTINGLFFDPQTERVIDYVGGQEDLASGIVRAIGRADERIEEDKLRMLRGVRFAARYGFELEKSTAAAIFRHAPQITQTSGERIGQEIRRMLEHRSAAAAMRWLGKLRLAVAIMPQTLAEQISHRALADLLNARPQPSFVVGLAALVAYAAPEQPGEVLGDLFRRWKLAGAERQAAEQAVAGFRTLLAADRLPWSVVQPILAGRYGAETLELAETWQSVFGSIDSEQGPESESGQGVSLARQRFAWPAERLDPPPLIDGGTLKMLGAKPGPQFRTILSAVRAAQLDGQIQREEEAKRLAMQIAAGEPEDQT